MNKILSPSILAADFTRLGEEVKAVEQAGAQYLHLDVMDGAFVPSISLGTPVIRSLRKVSGLTFDVHMMVQEPDRYIEDYAAAGADSITVHVEACTHLDRTLYHIRRLGKRVGIALNPATPLSVLDWVLPEADMVLLMTVNPGFGGQAYIPYVTEKIRRLRAQVEAMGLELDIEVDGGVTLANAADILEAGANVLVSGSAVFAGDVTANTRQFMGILQ